MATSLVMANNAFDRTAGPHSLAAAGQRDRWADKGMTMTGGQAQRLRVRSCRERLRVPMKLAVAKLVAFLTLGLLAVPLAAVGQQAGKVYRIGVVSSGGPEQESVLQATLRERLRERGWVEGQNLVVEWRYAEGKYERASELVDELVRRKPDLLMTRGGPVTTAAKRAVATIPIVMWGVTDPAGIGVVASLARPGGNVTGLSDDPSPEMMGKRLQLLKQVAPTVTKVAILTRVPPSGIVPRIASYETGLEAGAKALGLFVQRWPLQGPDDIDRAFPKLILEGF